MFLPFPDAMKKMYKGRTANSANVVSKTTGEATSGGGLPPALADN